MTKYIFVTGGFGDRGVAGTTTDRCCRQIFISERHRHRYAFNNDHRDALTRAGLTLSGMSPGEHPLEAVELSDLPFYVGVRYHPAFKSRPNRPRPLFCGLIEAALNKEEQHGA